VTFSGSSFTKEKDIENRGSWTISLAPNADN